MYAVEVRDHVMLAHSIPGEVFGPAQKLHGATYVIDVAFMRDTLSEDGEMNAEYVPRGGVA